MRSWLGALYYDKKLAEKDLIETSKALKIPQYYLILVRYQSQLRLQIKKKYKNKLK